MIDRKLLKYIPPEFRVFKDGNREGKTYYIMCPRYKVLSLKYDTLHYIAIHFTRLRRIEWNLEGCAYPDCIICKEYVKKSFVWETAYREIRR